MPDHIADATKKAQPARCPHCEGWFFPEEGVTLDDCPRCGRTVEVQPAPAQIPESDEAICARLLFACNGHPNALIPWPHRLLHDAVEHITSQARRLIEVEAERDAAEAKATRVCRSMLRIGKRLRIARNRVRGIGEELLCARERVGCPASVLLQLCDMRKALGLDLIKTCYTEILPAIQDVVIRAEAAEARVRELESFKSRVMEWARGRCECCEHKNVRREDTPCEQCLHTSNYDNWTPPQAWEVGE